MRQAAEAAREAWGLATMCGVAGKGETLDIVPRLLITGRRVDGHLVRRRQGPLAGARSSSTAGSPARSTSTRSSPSRVALDDVNDAFHAMERQEGIRTVIEFH